jgi:NAD-dependent deacetylase
MKALSETGRHNVTDSFFQPLVILTGAGVSAESGIRTFRAADGLWENHRIEDVATPGAFLRNSALVHQFYNERRRQLKDPVVQPNPAHLALARLEQEWDGDFLLVTQNVDDLHERAGSKRLLHMHGELKKAWCQSCDERMVWTDDLSEDNVCPKCQMKGRLRPDIVWFEEMPYHMPVITEALYNCALFISIGTSGRVYPAAGFAREAWKARRIEVNLTDSDISSHFHEQRIGPAGVEVPKLVEDILLRMQAGRGRK